MLQILMERISANEQENKRKSPVSQYSVQVMSKSAHQAIRPTNTGPSGQGKGAYIPGKSAHAHGGAVTPAVRPGSSLAGTYKRQRITDGSLIPTRSASPTKGRIPSDGTLPRAGTRAVPPLSQGAKHSQDYAALGWGRAPLSTQRTTSSGSSNRTSSSTLGSSLSTQCLTTSRSYTGGGSVSRQSSQQRSSRMKRESFKPRPSIDSVAVNGGWRGVSLKTMPLTEEE